MRARHIIIGVGLTIAALGAPPSVGAQVLPTGGEPILLDAGSEPRAALRYRWTQGHTERTEAVVDVSLQATEGSDTAITMRLPMEMVILARVTDTADDGSARVAMVFDDVAFGTIEASGAGIDAGGPAPAVLADSMDQAAALLTGIRTWQVMDDRGTILRSGMDLPAGVPPEATDQLLGASGSVPILPAEPVGVGATWESTGTTVTQGITLAVTTTTELVAVDGELVTLAMSTRLADGSGGLPPATLPFETFELGGGGQTQLDLAGIFPRTTTFGITMEMAGDLPIDSGTIAPVTMTVAVSMEMESEPVG